jgi:hypothetical protein
LLISKLPETSEGFGETEPTGTIGLSTGLQQILSSKIWFSTSISDKLGNRAKSWPLKVPVVTNGKEVKAVIDTGAEVTVMSETAFLGIPKEQRPVHRSAKRKN